MSAGPRAAATPSTRRLGAALAALLGLQLAQAAAAQDLPLSTAPYRYSPAPTRPLDSLEQQKAYSYRNNLSAQQRGMLTDRTLNRNSDGNAASQLRRQGELSRESGRMDHVLQR
jgi:hypothetical protein